LCHAKERIKVDLQTDQKLLYLGEIYGNGGTSWFYRADVAALEREI